MHLVPTIEGARTTIVSAVHGILHRGEAELRDAANLLRATLAAWIFTAPDDVRPLIEAELATLAEEAE
jgi:hypothetical protein